ncbi:MAG: alpha-amylase family glycosyl hydrolase [Candidatus Rokuibacteriota bacterium]
MRPERGEWWREGVLYQVYPRSFAGDLPGLIERLDYLAWLGVDGIWLNPIMPSPNADWGYDVSDYLDVHPDLGTLADLDALVAAANAHGIRVLLDLVPNHTSDRHPWFQEALRGRDSPRRDWYVWADAKPVGSPPNNWLSFFGGPAWTRDAASGQYYLHQFLPEQPDLNWWNEGVRAAFDEILRFWFARGVAGFRIDVPQVVVKDELLRDNPPVEDGDPWYVQRHGQRLQWNFMRPELEAVLRRWRAVADAQDPPRLLVGEGTIDSEHVATFYGSGDDALHMTFNLALANAPFRAEALREVVESAERSLPAGAWPLWTLGNHDISRNGSRWAGGDPRKIRAALHVLFGLRGAPTLYYGDELGLEDASVPPQDARDPAGRDPQRAPMPWEVMEEQRGDPGSVLSLTRELIAQRRGSADLRSGAYESLQAPEGAWAWKRGATATVAVNLSDEEQEVAGIRLAPWAYSVKT